jgi:hypothetical protein
MRTTTRKSRQGGAALIIGLILLAIITLLAVVGMNIANSELASATSEQIRLRAFQSAETGLEHGLVLMKKVGTGPLEMAGIKKDPVPVNGSPKDADGNAIDKYTNTITFRGTSTAEGYGGKDFAAFHYTVATDGTSSRNAVARHELGAYLVNTTGGGTSFGALPE